MVYNKNLRGLTVLDPLQTEEETISSSKKLPHASDSILKIKKKFKSL